MSQQAMTEGHQAILQSFGAMDAHSYGVLQVLMEIEPKIAKKIFENNIIMETFAMSGYNCMNILDYPMCGKCETIAAPDDPAFENGHIIPKCSCLAKGCGHTTRNPVTLKEWLLYELKRKAPADIADVLEYAIDDLAYAMVSKVVAERNSVLAKLAPQNREDMGITKNYAPVCEEQEAFVELIIMQNGERIDLNEEMRKLKEENDYNG